MKISLCKIGVVGLQLLLTITLFDLDRKVYAQGESAVPFLLIAPNARADGMGEAGAGLSEDVSAVFWNPAGLAFLKGQEVSLTHSPWLPQLGLSDLFYDFAAYRLYLPELLGTISASITYLNLGEFVITENDPTPLGTFKAYEIAFTAGYATRVFEDLGLGINLRYIRSSLAPFDVQGQGREGVADGISFDIATMWKPSSLLLPLVGDIGNALSLGVNFSNLGPKLTYIDADQADPLPTNLRVGLGIKIFQSQYNNISAIVDFSRILVRRHPFDTTTQKSKKPDEFYEAIFSSWYDAGFKKVTIGSGIEYWYGDPKLIALRFGYFYEHPKYGNRKFLTYGAGIRYDVYGFDFSYLSAVEENHPLAETLRFTLSIAWGGDEE